MLMSDTLLPTLRPSMLDIVGCMDRGRRMLTYADVC
jgi:hypothetical protein